MLRPRHAILHASSTSGLAALFLSEENRNEDLFTRIRMLIVAAGDCIGALTFQLLVAY